MLESVADLWRTQPLTKEDWHPLDAGQLRRWRHNLPHGRYPEPWFGIPTKARIFFLTLNPGHVENNASEGPVWRDFCAQMIAGNVTYGQFSRAATTGAARWVRRTYGGFENASIPAICNLRLIAYPSVAVGGLGEMGRRYDELETVRAIKTAVHEELVPRAKSGDILLLVLRAGLQWGFPAVAEDRWEGGLFLSKVVRTVSISPNSRVGPRIRRFLLDRGVEYCN